MTFPVDVTIPARIAVDCTFPRHFRLTGEETYLPTPVIDWMKSVDRYSGLFQDEQEQSQLTVNPEVSKDETEIEVLATKDDFAPVKTYSSPKQGRKNKR